MFAMETQGRSEAPGCLYFLFSFLSSYLFHASFFTSSILSLLASSLLFYLFSSFLSYFPFSSPFSPCSLTIYPSLLLQASPALSLPSSPSALLPSASTSRLRVGRQRGVLSSGSTWWSFCRKSSGRCWRACRCFPRGRRAQGSG